MAKQKRDFQREQQVWKDASPQLKAEALRETQNLAVIDGQVYNTETGEDVTDRVRVEPVISEAKREGAKVKQDLKQHEKENGGYVFAFYEVMKELSDRFPSLSQSDMARLMFIGTYVSFNEGEPGACYLIHDNGVKITKKSLGELLGMSRNKYGTFYKNLVNEDILKEFPEGLAMNPSIFYRGENLEIIKGSYQYTRIFRKTARDLYHKFNGRSIKKLGVLYSILPYVNFNYNIVCNNPQQVKNGKIDTMKLKDLAERLGYTDYRHLIKIMREIRYNDQPVFKFVDEGKDRRESYIIVNPNVIYAGNGKYLAGIKVLFQ